MRLICIMLALAAVVATGGCARFQTAVKPGPGLLYSNYKAPLTVNYDKTKTSGKSAQVLTYYIWEPIFGTSYSWGDASTQAAATQAGITKVNYADYEWWTILSIFGKFTVTVHGD